MSNNQQDSASSNEALHGAEDINQTKSKAKSEADKEAEIGAEVLKWKNDYLYLRAEFDNYRKNAIKERSDLVKYGAERFVTDFLDVVDNLERALLVTPQGDNLDSYVQGVQMIAKEIKNLLSKHNITSEECINKPFDPVQHEALGMEPTDVVAPGHILRVLRSPYRFHDKLIRPAQVVVAAAAGQSKK